MAKWDQAPIVGETAVAGPAWQRAPEVPGVMDKIVRQVELTGRHAVEGAMALPALGADAVSSIINLGIDAYNKATGSNVRPQMMTRDILDKGFDAVGAPKPQNATERIVGAGVRGMAGAGASVATGSAAAPGVVKDVLTARPDIQVLSGLGGGASGDVVREAGGGPVLQTAANLVGGVVLPAGVSVARGVPAFIENFTNAGQRNTAGQVLNDAAASSADSLAALQNPVSNVPGSHPTTGAVTRDPGLAALERSLVAKPTGSTISDRYGQNNDARMRELNKITGTQEDIDAAMLARTEGTKPLRDAALENANAGSVKTAELQDALAQKNQSVVDALQQKGQLATTEAEQFSRGTAPRLTGRLNSNMDRATEARNASSDVSKIEAQRKSERAFIEYKLNSLEHHGYSPLSVSVITDGLAGTMNTPGLRASTVVTKTLADVKDKLNSLADARGNIDARDLYTVRKEIGNTIEVHAKENANWDKQLTVGLSKDIQGQIDTAIKKAGAGDLWDQYLGKYKELSKPVNQMQTLQEVAKRSVGTAEDSLGNRQLLPSSFQRSMDNLDDISKSATGFNGATAENTLTTTQRTRLEALRQDLSGEAYAKGGGKVSGSNTVQLANYSTANIIGRIAGGRGDAGPITRNLARGLDFLNKYNDRDIDRILVEAAKDPALAGTLMKTATKDRLELAADAMNKIAKALGIGAVTNQAEQIGQKALGKQR